MKNRDRFKFNQFSSKNGIDEDYQTFQNVSDDVYNVSSLFLPLYKMDFDENTTREERNQVIQEWTDTLPKLQNVRKLYVRYNVNQEFFDSISEMPNLEELYFRSASCTSIKAIVNLNKLKCLRLDSFSNLEDISPLQNLPNLIKLQISNCFKITNYEIIGNINTLIGLSINGYDIGPRNLRLPSLSPFINLRNLKHLDLDYTSIVDKEYLEVLKLPKLQRFDILVKIPKVQRLQILEKNKTIEAGFFMDWDWDKNEMKNGKEW